MLGTSSLGAWNVQWAEAKSQDACAHGAHGERERAKKNKERDKRYTNKNKKIFSEMNIRISEDSHVASPPTATVIPEVAGPEPGGPLASVTGTWRTWRAVPSVTWGLEGSLGPWGVGYVTNMVHECSWYPVVFLVDIHNYGSWYPCLTMMDIWLIFMVHRWSFQWQKYVVRFGNTKINGGW